MNNNNRVFTVQLDGDQIAFTRMCIMVEIGNLKRVLKYTSLTDETRVELDECHKVLNGALGQLNAALEPAGG